MADNDTHAREEGKGTTTSSVNPYDTVISCLKSKTIREELTEEEHFNMLLLMCQVLSNGKINVKVPKDMKTGEAKVDGKHKASCNFNIQSSASKCKLSGNITFNLPSGLDADKAKEWLKVKFPEAEINDTRDAPTEADSDAVLDSINIGV